MSGELAGVVGAVLGVLLGFLGQVILTRRQEARRLDDARRELYATFLAETQRAINTLAEGALNRINGAIERGEYGTRFFSDHERVQASINGMELVSTPRVLAKANEFLQAHWDFANDEANAEPVDRDVVGDEVAGAFLHDAMQRLDQLSGLKSAFLAAAQHELRISSLVQRQSSE